MRGQPRQAKRAASIGLLRDGSDVLMVESRYPSIRQPFWALPGGFLEAKETAEQALVRVVREETALEVIGPILIAATIRMMTLDREGSWTTFLCEPQGWVGEPHPDNDPDGVTVAVAFVPIHEAIERLSAFPWGTSHAIVERLRGVPAGLEWEYVWPSNDLFDGKGPAQLIGSP